MMILGVAIYYFSSKTLFILAALFSVLFALAIILVNPEWSFEIVAFIIGALYVVLMAIWFNNTKNEFSFFWSLVVFLLSGSFSIVLSISLLYPIWGSLAYQEVETGWWVFSTTELQARSKFALILDRSGMIAGPVEEFAKLIAVLVVVKEKIVSRKTGVYYAVLCAIGFAMIENFYYFLQFGEVLPIRANPAHAVFSALWGAALGSYRANEKGFATLVWGLLLGMGLHAAWNLFASIKSPIFIYIFIFVTLSGLAFIRRELKEKSRENSSPTASEIA